MEQLTAVTIPTSDPGETDGHVDGVLRYSCNHYTRRRAVTTALRDISCKFLASTQALNIAKTFPELAAAIEAYKQENEDVVTTPSSKSTIRAGNGVVEDKGRFANDLVKLIVDCNLPFNIVDNPTFKTFLATWVPAMPVPSRDQLLTATQADHANLADVHYGLAIVDKWFGDVTRKVPMEFVDEVMEPPGAGNRASSTATESTSTTPTHPKTIEMASNLTYATEAAKLAGLGSDLTSKLSTVFVPSDEALAAYAAANPSVVTALSGSGSAAAVTAHVVPNSALTAADLPEGESTYNTVAGTPLLVKKAGGKVMVSSGLASASVIQSDISTGNAIIHIIDNVRQGQTHMRSSLQRQLLMAWLC
ncbi:hypothetical protein QJQ45_010173 [Haematococcus lacustris]|nr:hypothetical protein QJQ45_010173 [Haematococcus lacustris]